MASLKIFGPFAELLSFQDASNKGPLQDEELTIHKAYGILVDGSIIKSIALYESLVADYPSIELIELPKSCTVIPGMIDCHTHICFGGTRARDFAMRNAGKTYLEIAKEGGGIWDTVKQTRSATEQELVDLTIKRATVLLQRGITTIEVKSGYGLSVSEELKMLKAIAKANKKTAAELIPTCLAAHIKPKDFLGDHAQYLNVIAHELLPEIVSQKLSKRLDVFVEEEAFSQEVVHPYFAAAKMMGFNLTVHADQFHTGGSVVAVEHQAQSADHLEASGPEEIQLLAGSEVVAVALPGASIGLGVRFTPARQLLDAGCSLAIASDWNPGSAPMGDLMAQASILATYEKLSNAEVIAGVTYRAAHALGITDQGRLSSGYQADFNVYDTGDHREITYQQGQLRPIMVIKGGEVVFSAV